MACYSEHSNHNGKAGAGCNVGMDQWKEIASQREYSESRSSGLFWLPVTTLRCREELYTCWAGLNSLITDLCYNIRHFELHGRDLEDPWSCRQSVVYQKHYHASRCSKWIMIQPPKLVLLELAKIQNFGEAHPLAFHARIFESAIANWRPYLNYMTEQLLELVTKHFTNLKIIN